jgi:hypothetical protein
MGDRTNNPLGVVAYGRNHNFFQNVTPTSNGSGIFNASADICITFTTNTVTFMFQPGTASTAAVQYSFNGITVDGDMSYASGSLTGSLVFRDRVISKVWFTIISGSPVIRVEAWANS